MRDALPPPDRLWSHFPHCPRCHKRLWAATTYRHKRDPRGPLVLPTRTGCCPHCGKDLYETNPKGTPA
jgi:hypothetical protein